jgi:hypothetical protein
MSGRLTGVAGNRNSKYRTAAILAAVALGLFLYTLYAGLK